MDDSAAGSPGGNWIARHSSVSQLGPQRGRLGENPGQEGLSSSAFGGLGSGLPGALPLTRRLNRKEGRNWFAPFSTATHGFLKTFFLL